MKKLLSILLTVAMLVCLLPVFAVSADEITDGVVHSETTTLTEGDDDFVLEDGFLIR